MDNNKFKKIIKILILWIVLIIIILIAVKFHLNKKITTSLIILYGLITPVFTGIISTLGIWISAVPWIGPFIIKLISLPLVWLINGIAYLGSIFFVARGETKKAIDARILGTFFLIGFLLGYVLGKIF
ncbi:hypothetical protein HY745_07530 [Candidatus Desantisbacteria bacterium]|nr:hypothetical protein [Candidatus Desantisbacteria bacterium]